MKRKTSHLAEVQLDEPGTVAGHLEAGAARTAPPFVVRLPEGATVAVPAGFAAEEVLLLLTVVREALR